MVLFPEMILRPAMLEMHGKAAAKGGGGVSDVAYIAGFTVPGCASKAVNYVGLFKCGGGGGGVVPHDQGRSFRCFVEYYEAKFVIVLDRCDVFQDYVAYGLLILLVRWCECVPVVDLNVVRVFRTLVGRGRGGSDVVVNHVVHDAVKVSVTVAIVYQHLSHSIKLAIDKWPGRTVIQSTPDV